MNEFILNQKIPIWIILISILWVTNLIGILKVAFNNIRKRNKFDSDYPKREKQNNKIRFQLESVLGFSIFMGVLGCAYDIQASELETDYIFDIDSLTNTASFFISFVSTFIGIIVLSWIDFNLNRTHENKNYA